MKSKFKVGDIISISGFGDYYFLIINKKFSMPGGFKYLLIAAGGFSSEKVKYVETHGTLVTDIFRGMLVS